MKSNDISKTIKLFEKRMNVTSDQLFEYCNKPDIAEKRFLLWRLVKEKHDLSNTEIAKVFNRNNHSTIWHGLNKINNLLEIGDKQTVDNWNKVKDI